MNTGIYQILNLVNNKRYIGSAINIERRFKEHLKGLRGNIHYNTHLQRAWNKYGETSFKLEVLVYCKKEELLDREQKKIDHYKTSKGNIYNICPIAGNSLGRHCSDITKERISKANKGKIRSEEIRSKLSGIFTGHRGWNKGMIVSLETRSKLSIAGKGKIVSSETKEKLSKANKGKYTPLSLESRKKISESNKGRVAWNKGIPAWNKGKKLPKLSEDHKRKISEGNKGKKLSEEVKRKIRESNVGQKRSEESKQKMRKPHKRKVSVKQLL